MAFTTLYEVLNVFSPIILVIGLSIGLYYFKSLNVIHKSITSYLLVMLCVDMTGRLFEYYNGNNLVVLLVYSLVEMMLFVYFYFKYLYKSRYVLLIGFSIIAAAYIVWELIYFSRDVKQFQSYAKVVDNFVIITLALVFLNEKIRNYKESKLDIFYLNSAVLIFFSVNLIFFLPLNFILNEKMGFYFWLFNLISTVSFYLYLTHLIWKNARITKHPLKKKAIS